MNEGASKINKLEENKKIREAQRKDDALAELLGELAFSEESVQAPETKDANVTFTTLDAAAHVMVKKDREATLKNRAIQNKERGKRDAETKKKEAADQLARIDSLTGLYNRRAHEDELIRRHQAAQRSAIAKENLKEHPIEMQNFGLIIIDLDHFKTANDMNGHAFGDMILQEVAHILREKTRAGSDHVSRWGGDEYALIIPYDNVNDLIQVAEHLRDSIEQHDFKATDENMGTTKRAWITASIGVSPYEKYHGIGYDKIKDRMFTQADKAMYLAKGKYSSMDEVTVNADDAITGGLPRNRVIYYDTKNDDYELYKASPSE